MKLSFLGYVLFVVVYALCSTNVFSQQLADEVQSMLNESDQKKLTKMDETSTKGDLILSKAGYPGDEQLLDSPDPDGKLTKKYFTKRIEATDYYRVANSGKLDIYDRNIKDFWKKYTGEHYKLESVRKAEAEAATQFKEAQQYRKDAAKNARMKDWLPLILKAEQSEKDALLKMQKVLFVYLNYPAQYNEAWFTPDTVSKKKTPPVVATSVTATEVKPVAMKVEVTPKKPATTVDSSIYSMVGVDEKQIDLFNRFLQKEYPKDYEKYIINFSSVNYTDMQSLRNAWYKYKFGVLEDSTQYYAAQKEAAVPLDTAKHMMAQDINNKKGTSQVKSSTAQMSSKTGVATTSTTLNKTGEGESGVQSTLKPDNTAPRDEKLTKQNTVPKSKGNVADNAEIAAAESTPSTKNVAGSKTFSNTTQNTKTTGSNEISSGTKKDTEPIAHGFLYKVQIVACRVPLDNNVLASIYKGKEQIRETNEDQWYKYTIGNFPTHNEARQLRDQLNIPGVFVVAYLNGKRIKLLPGAGIDGSLPADIHPELIQFRVQIAASKNELSPAVLRRIYNGTNEIVSVSEDDWFKYSLNSGNSLKDALALSKNIDVPRAFIVAYYNNQKISLLSAIRLTNNY
jgi:hypothetical protein